MMVCQLEEGPKQRILTVANLVTVLGMAATLWSLWLLFHGYMLASFLALLIAAYSDFADGWVARFIEDHYPGYGISKFGTFLDPVRDKFLGTIIIPLSLLGATGFWWPVGLIAWEVIVVGLLSLAHVSGRGMQVIRPSKIITLCQSLIILVWFGLLCWDSSLPLVSFVALSCLSVLSVSRAYFYWAYKPTHQRFSN